MSEDEKSGTSISNRTALCAMLGLGLAAYFIGCAAWMALPKFIFSESSASFELTWWLTVVGYLVCLPAGIFLICKSTAKRFSLGVVTALLVPLPAIGYVLIFGNLASIAGLWVILALSLYFLLMKTPKRSLE